MSQGGGAKSRWPLWAALVTLAMTVLVMLVVDRGSRHARSGSFGAEMSEAGDPGRMARDLAQPALETLAPPLAAGSGPAPTALVEASRTGRDRHLEAHPTPASQDPVLAARLEAIVGLHADFADSRTPGTHGSLRKGASLLKMLVLAEHDLAGNFIDHGLGVEFKLPRPRAGEWRAANGGREYSVDLTHYPLLVEIAGLGATGASESVPSSSPGPQAMTAAQLSALEDMYVRVHTQLTTPR